MQVCLSCQSEYSIQQTEKTNIMKKLLLLLTIIYLAQNIQGQEKKGDKKVDQITQLEKGNYYKQKSKNQKLAGWLLLGSGIVLYGVSLGTGYVDPFDPYPNTSTKASDITFILGTGSLIGSLTSFILGSKNKGRAEILLSNYSIPISIDPGKNISVKSVGIGINIGR
jgi:hypothetical protein